MKLPLRTALIVFGLVVVAVSKLAWSDEVRSEEVRTYADNEKALAVIDEMVKEEGFDRQALQALFAQVNFKQKIVDLKTRPAEGKAWKDYRPILVTPQRTRQGVKFWKENKEMLARAETMFGVPAEIIVAIIGVETRYGRIMGRYRVIDALATLAFDYHRGSYFRGQLKEFLVLTRDEKFDPLALKGSYAGAMGLGQFMPGSFRNYAVDFDGDGKKDIWKNPTDGIGSVANYFRKHGWKPGEPVTSIAKVKDGGYQGAVVKTRKDLKPTQTLADIMKAGLEPAEAFDGAQSATAMHFDGAEGDEYWVGLHNFYVITRYNHSSKYALAVYQLSQDLARAYYQDS